MFPDTWDSAIRALPTSDTLSVNAFDFSSPYLANSAVPGILGTLEIALSKAISLSFWRSCCFSNDSPVAFLIKALVALVNSWAGPLLTNSSAKVIGPTFSGISMPCCSSTCLGMFLAADSRPWGMANVGPIAPAAIILLASPRPVPTV